VDKDRTDLFIGHFLLAGSVADLPEITPMTKTLNDNLPALSPNMIYQGRFSFFFFFFSFFLFGLNESRGHQKYNLLG
jgi:hypothetical protein